MTNFARRAIIEWPSVQRMAARFHGQSWPGRWATAGAAGLGALGALAGLILGLLAYPPTAPVAVVELGLPATIVGGVIGLVAGLIVVAGRRIRLRPGRRARKVVVN
jgi:hypothetical protein